MRIVTKIYPRGVKTVGLIFDKKFKKIALVERTKGKRHYFVFPGGGIEDSDKNIKDSLTREIKEETSLKVKIICQPYRLNIKGHNKQIFFVCEYISGKIKMIGEEKDKQNKNDKYKPRWVKVENLPYIKVYPIEIRDWLVDDLKNKKWVDKKILTLNSFKELKN